VHELGIAEGILSSAIDAAEGAGGSTINVVEVTIGELTEVMEDALHFAWDAIIPETIAAAAVLNVTMVGAASRCADCDHEWEHGRFDGAQCPACGGYLITLVRGRELRITSIDID
jgi:hydrogenase nickel incorporation protein HypA/HybF